MSPHHHHHHHKAKKTAAKSGSKKQRGSGSSRSIEAPGAYLTSSSQITATAAEDDGDEIVATVDENDGGFEFVEGGGLKSSLNYSSNNNGSSSIFLKRKGKSLEWKNISMSLKQTARKKQKKKDNTTTTSPKSLHILQSVSGTVQAAQVTAIMGPSGGGKTSLLKVLTGRVGSNSKQYEISGQVVLDDQIVNPTSIATRRQIAYVEQELSIPQTSTPREAIKFSARLRLDRTVSNTEIDDLADEIVTEMGLTHCSDTLIGGNIFSANSTGLSGGERKRVSVGVELVVRPSIIILDEPTSGLDSFSAEQLVLILRRIAKIGGSSVLLTIHQPSPPVLRKLDSILLLHKGQIMYDGSVDQIPNYFANKGYPKPDDYNVADWIMTVAQSEPIERLQESGFFQQQNDNSNTMLMAGRAKAVAAASMINTRTQQQPQEEDPTNTEPRKRVHITTEIKLLFGREIKHLIRDKASLIARIGLTSCFGLFFGLIYLDIGTTDLNDPLNLQAEFGAITNLLISTLFGVAQAAMLEFPKDRPVFLREYSTNHYSVLPYFIAKLSVEGTITFAQVLAQLLTSYFLMSLRMNFIVFLLISYVLAMASTSIGVLIGSLVEDPKVAAELMPVLIVPQLMFSGFFISTDMIPSFLRWAQYLCSLTYAIRLSLKYEFEDCDTAPCSETLERNSVYELDSGVYWIILILLFAISRIAGMIVLRNRAKF